MSPKGHTQGCLVVTVSPSAQTAAAGRVLRVVASVSPSMFGSDF